MDDLHLPPPEGDPAPIADAGGLLDGAEAPAAPAAPAPVAPSPGEGYGLEDRPEVTQSSVTPPVVRPAASASAATRVPKAAAPPQAPREPDEAVRQVWSRASEWGATMLTVAAAAAGLLVLLYLLFSMELYGTAFVMLMAGGVALALLSYPILITLERPVRVTPEQAVRDFFGALSHHVPHYRRMWLLLSDRGKFSGVFATFDGFRNYWKGRLAQLRAEGRAGGFTPLRFLVDDFRSDKSIGKNEVDASFTVRILVRGKQADGPVQSIRVETRLVRGPDRMWYLDRGTLP